MKGWYLTIIFLLQAFLCFSQLTGKVVGVVDGDTFTLLTDDKQQYRIRLFGIDCPESKQDYGQVAKQFTSDMIFGKRVYVHQRDIDKYGRTIGMVYALPDSSNLNEALLKAGLAWHYVYFDKNHPEWDKLEEQARKEKIGLWQVEAIAPWEYRRR